MSLQKSIKKEFTTRSWVLIPIAIGINVVGSLINHALNLPLFLDSIGTILSGVIVGPFVGALVGILTNVITAITSSPQSLPFAIVNMVIGLLSGFFAIKGFFKTIPKAIIAGLIIAVITALIGTPISVILFGGITGDGKDAITAVVLSTGKNLYKAALAGNGVASILDKVISCVLVYFISIGLPKKYLESLKAYE